MNAQVLEPFWSSSFPIRQPGQEASRQCAASRDPAQPLRGLSFATEMGPDLSLAGTGNRTQQARHARAEMLTVAVPPHNTLLSLHESAPENWHSPLSNVRVRTARSSNALVHPPARDHVV